MRTTMLSIEVVECTAAYEFSPTLTDCTFHE